MQFLKKVVEDTLIDVKFSGLSWRNEGFYYSSYENQRSELSAKQMSTNYISINWEQLKEDKVILVQTKKRRYIGGYVTEDNRYLVISAANSTYGIVHKDLTKQDSPLYYCG
jgi:prolyl oligopeptidase